MSQQYQKLPTSRTKSNFIVQFFYSLWLGEDHLLSIEKVFYKENYRRYYYCDIQSIILHKTATGRIWNIVLFLFVALFAWFSFLAAGEPVAQIWLLGFTGFFLLCLVINTLRGATCDCYLTTPIQRVKLHALHRVPKAMQTLDMIRERIAKVQYEQAQSGEGQAPEGEGDGS